MTPDQYEKSQFRLSESTRVEYFSDAVFAIIITLLVIEIHRPIFDPGGLIAELLHAWPSYLAVVLAFLYVGVVWLNHHAIFQYIRLVDPCLIWINIGILGTTALLPFPTGVMAEAFRVGDMTDQRAAVVLYALVGMMMSASWLPLFPYLHAHPELAYPNVPPGTFAAQISRPLTGVVLYAAAALLGWYVSPMIGLCLFIVMVFYHAWTSQGVAKKTVPPPS